MGLLVYDWLSPVVRNRSLATDFILSRHPGVASPSAQLSPWGDTEQLWTHLGTSLIIHYTTADISTTIVLNYVCYSKICLLARFVFRVSLRKVWNKYFTSQLSCWRDRCKFQLTRQLSEFTFIYNKKNNQTQRCKKFLHFFSSPFLYWLNTNKEFSFKLYAR